MITDTNRPAANTTQPTHQLHGSERLCHNASTAVHGTTSVHPAFAVQERFKCMEAFCRLAGEETRTGQKKIIYCPEKRDACQEDVGGEIGKCSEMEKEGARDRDK